MAKSGRDELHASERAAHGGSLSGWILILLCGVALSGSLVGLHATRLAWPWIELVLAYGFLLLVLWTSLQNAGRGVFVVWVLQVAAFLAFWRLDGALHSAYLAPLLLTGIGAVMVWRTARSRSGERRRLSTELSRSAEPETFIAQIPGAEMPADLTRIDTMSAIEAAIGAVSDDQTLYRVVHVLAEEWQCAVALFVAAPGDQWLELESASGLTVGGIAETALRVEVGGETALGQCVSKAEVVVIGDLLRESRAPDWQLPGMRSKAVVPLIARGRVVGALVLLNSRLDRFTDQDVAILQAIAGQIAYALVSIRTEAEALRVQSDLGELQRRYVLESWKQFVPDQAGYRWREGRVEPLGHKPLPEVARTLAEGQTHIDSQGTVVAPISFGGQVLGALGLSDPDRAASWTDDEIDLVQSVATQMGMVIQNIQLIDEARESLAQITSLHRRYLDAEWERFVPGREQVEFSFAQPGIDAEEVLSLPLGQELLAGQPGTVARFSEGVHESALVAPISLRDHVYGELALQDMGAPRDWSEDDLAIVSAVTDQVAMAIENARLFAETERRAAELQEIAEQLRETDKFRAQFLATMSHELRTPLNSIIGFSRVILKGIDGPLTDLQKTDLEAIYNNGQHLLQMINDILDMSKIEAGMMELVIENVDLGVIIKGVVSATTVLTKEKPVEVRTEVAPRMPVIQADGARVRQIITNLMSNAVKFTDEGSIVLRAWYDEAWVYVSVTDTGVGIPADKLDLVFDQFRQVDSSSTRRAEGTGLGLPITKHFVALHGGDLTVVSTEGVGSSFTFVLPIDGPTAHVPELAGLEIDPSKRMLLVIDRDQEQVAEYERCLNGNRFQLVGLYDGAEAIRWSRYLKPWAILMDVDLANDDGWETMDALKSTRATRNIPLVVCSTLREGARAISMGAVAYLSKPLQGSELVETLTKLER